MSRISKAFNRDTLATICAMPERDFASAYDMTTVMLDRPGPENFYFFKDNGASVLAVAHLDTVGGPDERAAHFVDTEAGPVVFSRALDDRLGAYIILELLPDLGITYDVLLTVGEESGQSTAEEFDTDKDYDWIIEFDRGGTDVVMYQYDDDETREAVRDSGARVGDGIFSDISYMDHLGRKGFNWGVGYRDYHGPRAHAFLNDTFDMVGHYLRFHRANEGRCFPHFADDSDANWWNEPRNTDRYDFEEPVYFERDYIEDPTPEEIQAALEGLDDEDYLRSA